MDPTATYWAIGLPVFLIFVGTGVATVAPLSDSQSVGFVVGRICFILAAITFIAFSLYWLYQSRLSIWITIALSTSVGLSLPALMASLYWIQYIENSLSTKLFPANLPSPPLPPRVTIPDGALRVYLGTSIAWATSSMFNIVVIGNDPLIQISRDDTTKDIKVTVLKLFDDRYDIIATIDQDGFWVKNTNRSKRPDTSTLVVYDHDDKEALRISMLNKDAVMVTGIFNDRRLRAPIVVDKDFIEINTNKFYKASFGNNAGSAIRVGL